MGENPTGRPLESRQGEVEGLGAEAANWIAAAQDAYLDQSIQTVQKSVHPASTFHTALVELILEDLLRERDFLELEENLSIIPGRSRDLGRVPLTLDLWEFLTASQRWYAERPQTYPSDFSFADYDLPGFVFTCRRVILCRCLSMNRAKESI